MDQNLFNVAFTQGNLERIAFIRDMVGSLSVMVISLVGFGIVMASIMKNAFRGLYHVYPSFFEKVDELKTNAANMRAGSAGERTAAAQVGQASSVALGWALTILLSLVPNVKAMTDIDDDPVDAKTYFTRAIPIMCISIFVGAFIFFGYPTKVAEKVSRFGLTIVDVALVNVDPAAWAEELPTKIVNYKLSTKGSKNPYDKFVYEATNKAAAATFSILSDTEKQGRINCAREIEAWLKNEASKDKDIIISDDWKYSVEATVDYSKPDISAYTNNTVDGYKQFAYIKPLSDFNHGSKLLKNDMYLRVNVSCSEKANTFVKPNTAKCIVKGVRITNGDTITIAFGGNVDVPNTIQIAGISANVEGGKTNKITITKSKNGQFKEISSKLSSSSVVVSGINYVDGEGKSHPVVQLDTDGSGFAAAPGSNSRYVKSTWGWGESPMKKSTDTSTDSGNTSGSTSSGRPKDNVPGVNMNQAKGGN